MCGNSVAIIGDDGVLMFDSTATPKTAATLLAELRKLTPLPVRYVVNSHWHWDHWGGNQVFQDANPGVQFITHEKTRELMLTVEPRWNDRGLKEDLPQFLDDFARQIADLKAKGGAPDRIARAEERLAADRDFYEQKTTLRKIIPNKTFRDTMTVRLGKREIQILHAEGITPGDTYLWLPQEKVLVTGDILLDPYPFAIGGSYPAEWTATLKKFIAMQPAIVIPGHGDAQQGAALLERNLAMFEAVMADVRAAKTAGKDADATVASLDAKKLAAMVNAPDPEQFKMYFLDVFAKRAWRELDAPLGDLPDGMK
jgi:glyoxylase-like metal-dependent hydrolase (beta-lactamase superfamily II)